MSGLGEHVFDKVARPADGYKTPLSLFSVRPRAGGGIGRRARLRALWAEWPVEVRVLFGALEKPVFVGLFGPSSLSLESAAGPRDNTRDNKRRQIVSPASRMTVALRPAAAALCPDDGTETGRGRGRCATCCDPLRSLESSASRGRGSTTPPRRTDPLRQARRSRRPSSLHRRGRRPLARRGPLRLAARRHERRDL